MDRPSRDLVLMDVARAFSNRSTCSRAAVGAVFSIQGRILSTGYNGAPSGMAHCDHSQDHASPFTGKDGCFLAVHAEANGIAWAARHGVALNGAEVHTTLAPCMACAQLMVNAGISRVVYAHDYRIASGVVLLRAAMVVVESEAELNAS